MIRFRVHQGFGAAGKWNDQGTLRTARNFEPEDLAIEVLRLLNIIHRKTAERLVSVDHHELLDFQVSDDAMQNKRSRLVENREQGHVLKSSIRLSATWKA